MRENENYCFMGTEFLLGTMKTVGERKWWLHNTGSVTNDTK